MALQPLGTEGQQVSGKFPDRHYPKPYKRTQLSIPMGAGINYKVNRQINLGYEIGWRKTFTDYLDDVSGRYANPADLGQTVVNGKVVDSQTSFLADPSDRNFDNRSNPNYARFAGAYGVYRSQRGNEQ